MQGEDGDAWVAFREPFRRHVIRVARIVHQSEAANHQGEKSAGGDAVKERQPPKNPSETEEFSCTALGEAGTLGGAR